MTDEEIAQIRARTTIRLEGDWYGHDVPRLLDALETARRALKDCEDDFDSVNESLGEARRELAGQVAAATTAIDRAEQLEADLAAERATAEAIAAWLENGPDIVYGAELLANYIRSGAWRRPKKP